MSLKRSPLYDCSLKEGGKMTPFSGWEMPIQFSGLIKEHKAVRKSSGLFDISHMGILQIEGKNTKAELQKLVPSDLFRIGPGEAIYTVLLNHEGGIIDDLIIYDLGTNKANNQKLLLIVNAGCYEKDLEWLNKNLNINNVSISNSKNHEILLALQGPKSVEILEKVLGKTLGNFPSFSHREIKFLREGSKEEDSIFIAKTGYTGEKGFELLLSNTAGQFLWRALIKEGVTPCGLGARDTLRLEAGLHLYGNDIDVKTNPFEAGLGWLVHLEMPYDFIGRQALETQAKRGISNRLAGIKLLDKGIPRKGYKVISNNKIIGEITSGTWSPTLERGIAMAYLPKELSKVGSEVEVVIREKKHLARIVKKPFYRRAS